MMELYAIVENVRDHYLAQYEAFVESELSACTACAPEVKFQMPPENAVYRNLYCVDFVVNDSGPEVRELFPDRGLEFPTINSEINGVSISIATMRWDNTLLEADKPIEDEDISNWFHYWFDVEETRYDESKTFGNIIHSALLKDGSLTVDFGSSDPSAFWELVDALRNAGVKTLKVTYGEGTEVAAN